MHLYSMSTSGKACVAESEIFPSVTDWNYSTQDHRRFHRKKKLKAKFNSLKNLRYRPPVPGRSFNTSENHRGFEIVIFLVLCCSNIAVNSRCNTTRTSSLVNVLIFPLRFDLSLIKVFKRCRI